MRTWQIDEGKFLSEVEVNSLTSFLKRRSNDALRNGHKARPNDRSVGRVAVNDWLVIDIALSTGLRVSEIADLRCGDIWADDGKASLVVRNGKNGKHRIVRFNNSLKEHLNEYLEWKKGKGEDCGPQSPLILSSNTMEQMTTRALQKAFERNARRVGIQGNLCRGHRPRYSIHSLRHTYATFLLRASGNLRLVQKQLGHSSITTTQVYADVLNPDLDRALAKLYKRIYRTLAKCPFCHSERSEA
ncbi:MAG: site-specific integrase, partial [Planctomycetes bacterium]|nr:site-specific integrase [Planctomycetota bacterium]